MRPLDAHRQSAAELVFQVQHSQNSLREQNISPNTTIQHKFFIEHYSMRMLIIFFNPALPYFLYFLFLNHNSRSIFTLKK